MSLHRYVTCLLVTLGVCGCTSSPDLYGEWEGITAPSSGLGFYYTLSLRETATNQVSGSGGISIYSREDAAADSTIELDVEGTYNYPDLSLVISGPFPSVGGQVSAEFTGTVSPDGSRIEGTLHSSRTGEVKLDLVRVE
jgi:hypothetical protein